MEIITIDSLEKARTAIAAVGSTAAGVEIMAAKAVFLPLKFTAVDTRAANLLKQTLLSKGGDAAISAHCADLGATTSDVLLLGTLAQYAAAVPVLLQQPWGLKKIAQQLLDLLREQRCR